MTTPTPLDQKVRQLDNDVQALYELIYQISTTQKRHTNRFNEVTQDVAGLGTRLDSIETQVAALATEVGSIAKKLDRVLELLQS